MRYLIKDTFLYGLAMSGMKVAAIVTLPLMARSLLAEELGVVDAVLVISGILISCTTLGQDSALARFFHETQDEVSRHRILGGTFAIQFTSTLVAVVIVVVGVDRIAPELESVPGFRQSALLMAASLVPLGISRFCLNFLKWNMQQNQYLWSAITCAALNAVLVIVFISVFKTGVVGYFTAQLIAAIGGAFISVLFCRGHLRLKFDNVAWRQLIVYGLPYACIALVGLLFSAIDRTAVTEVLGIAALGAYSIASKVGSFISFGTLAFQTAWGPFAFAEYQNQSAAQKYTQALLIFCAIGAGILVLLGGTSTLILDAVGAGKAAGGEYIVVFLGAALLLDGVCGITGIGVDLAKRTTWAIAPFAIGLLTSYCAVSYLVKPFGTNGVAIGIFMGKVMQTLAATLIGRNLYPIKIEFYRSFAILTIGVSIAFAAASLSRTGMLVFEIGGILSVIIIPLSVWLLLQKSDREKIRSVVFRNRKHDYEK